MIEIFSATQCKQMDNDAINNIQIPGSILMENAAMAISNEIIDKAKSFLIFCGKGNNGGDALAISRKLILGGKSVKIYIVSKDESYSKDFQLNLNIIKNIIDKSDIIYIKSKDDIDENIINDLQKYDVVVDGIFGIGLNRDLNDMFEKIISYINQYSKVTISIDIPSGLDSDTGIARGCAIKADLTYTFEVLKKGFLNYDSFKYIGNVKVLKIGIPNKVKNKISHKLYMLEKYELEKIIPERSVYGHKGTYGRAIVFAGKKGFMGAAYIATECTIRAGAGLTTLISHKDVQLAMQSKLIEAMTLNLEDLEVIDSIKNATSIAFGPGFGFGKEEKNILQKVIYNSNCPIVIDADGITLLTDNKLWLDKLRGRAIITPHPGEMARFLGISISEVEKNRINIAKEIAKKYDITVLLKGYNTVISDGENTYINPTGNSKMASGGMGDALTGIINAFLSQGVKCKEAAILGAYIHGAIGDKLADEFYIVNARDIIRELPKEINNINSKLTIKN